MPAPHESFSTFKNWYMMGFDPRSKISSMLKALKTGILRVRISVVLTTLFALALLALVSYLATARNSGSELVEDTARNLAACAGFDVPISRC